jgi:hypothetical protein
MGHEVDRRDMGIWYDNRPVQDILVEQAQVFPNGVLAVLDPPRIAVVDDIPAEVLEAVRGFWDGRLLPSDLVSRLLDLKARRQNPEILTK